MELVNILSKVVKENLTTKKILLEYPESTVKKLLDKFQFYLVQIFYTIKTMLK
jgi:hypothetical protein